jgi:hypothetical protein
MSDLTFHHFTIILIIIGFYFIFNYLLSLYNFNLFELFEFFDLCSLKNEEPNKKSNIKSQIKKGRELIMKKVKKRFDLINEHGIDKI